MVDEKIFDVAIHTTGAFRASFQEFPMAPPPEGEFLLGEHLWVGSPPYEINTDIIFDACTPAGYNFRPTRQYGSRYCICREVPADPAHYYVWDHGGGLSRLLFLSRLLRPTSIGTRYSAKLYFRNGELETIVPGPTQGFGVHAWVVANNEWRDWLSVAEFTSLGSLIPKYALGVPDRIRQARRHLDHAFHSFYLDQRCASLVTAFESLLKVSPYQATKQFASRASRLARLIGLDLTQSEAEALYSDRSAFVHGTQVSFTEFTDELICQYNRFESVLRVALLRASTESDFASLFATDQTIIDTFGE
jgi:hypothetical protein